MRVGRALVCALLGLSCSAVSAFVPSALGPRGCSRGGRPSVAMRAEIDAEGAAISRQSLLQGAAAATFVALLGYNPSAARAGLPPAGPSRAEMLKRAMGDNKKDDDARKAELAQIRKERLERMKQLEAEEQARKTDASKKEVELEADLRANYYYPTARKRYLPRIKAAADGLADARSAIQGGEWASAEMFANKVAEDAALPLKLYASSLTGQGLSLDAGFVKTLQEQGDAYGKELDAFKKAVGRKDKNQALTTLGKLELALNTYRKTAKIDTPDGGIGEFPTDSKLGAAFGNNNPTLYKKNGRT